MGSDRNKRKRENLRRNRKIRLEQANTEGWNRCTDFHFQKCVSGFLVNWYPSRRKMVINGVTYMVDGPEDAIFLAKSLREENANGKA